MQLQFTQLETRLVGSIAAVLLLVASVASWQSFVDVRAALTSLVDSNGQSLVSAAASFSGEHLLLEDYPVLETYASEMLSKSTDIAFVRIYREDGVAVVDLVQSPVADDPAVFAADVGLHGMPDIVGRVVLGISMRQTSAAISAHARQLLVTWLIAFGLVGTAMFVLLRLWVLRPLSRLDEMATALGHGDLKSTIELPSRDELGRLAGTLEQMRERLNHSYSALNEKNLALTELDALKDEFLANVSHELKTPLNGLLGLLDAIHGGAYGETPPKFERPIQAMDTSARRLHALTERILTFDSMNRVDSFIQYQEILLRPYFQSIGDQLDADCRSKNLRYALDIPESMTIISDTFLLDEIFFNLLANAVKFTDQGNICVHAEASDDSISISVTDTGIGIDADLHDVVFERFRQGFASETRTHEGSGIGLSLVRRACEKLGGDVALTSAPGLGSTFTVTLPVPRDTVVSVTHSSRHNPPGARVTQHNALRSSSNPHEKSLPPDPPLVESSNWDESDAQPKPRILAVDDDAINRQVLRAQLGDAYEVIEARDGADCLQALSRESFDIVLLDLMMPNVSGFDVLESCRANTDVRLPPIIVLSALRDETAILRAFRLGAVDFVSKPFNRAELLARVRAHVTLFWREAQLTSTVDSQAEQLETAESRLMQSEKMAAVGQLAAGVAHEINNPVSFVRSNLQMLRTYWLDLTNLIEQYQDLKARQPEGVVAQISELERSIELDELKDELPALLDDTISGVERVQTIVKDLREFSHSGIDDRQLCDLNAVVESSLNIVNSEVKYKAEVAKSLGELPQVECVASQIGQVIVNFLVNAAQAIEDRGVIEISTGCEDERVWISVRDTGHGVEPQHLRHIFEPFFTTKPVGKGTGLGLSLSYGIIRRHNGDITVDSTPGEGTCFTVWLPIVQSVESKNAA